MSGRRGTALRSAPYRHSFRANPDTPSRRYPAGVIVDEERLRSFCDDHGIRRLRLFGSALRETLQPDSDIDLLVDFETDRTPGLLGISRMELELAEVFGRAVEVRTIHELSRHFRDQVAAYAALRR